MKGRRGSALLIVLGFLSFMVVSAVAFSIYMRSERVPSSVFRKNVAIRHLVQSGLAHAMSELDDAIRDDPFPGVVKNPGSNVKFMGQANRNVPVNPPYAGLDGSRRYIDWWLGRVFMPPNPDDEHEGSLMAPEGQTVAVVNLEGLGYVPPPLINDVRFLSRRTWSAKWRNFDYGVGRFAYCAVNVSDYFDINRMSIAESRSGFRRVSLAPLFRSGSDPNRLNVDFGKINSFRNFLGSPGSDSDGAQNSWQLVSMLDYALANQNGRSGFQSYPFYDWIDRSTKQMYKDQDRDDAQYQTFVTDSWFPASYKDEARPTLALDATGNRRGQPFDLGAYANLTKNNVNVDDLVEEDFPITKGDNGVSFDRMLSATEIVALYDYLDRDDIPLSLALPTVERVPMVVAVSPQGHCNLKVPAVTLEQATPAKSPVSTTINMTGLWNSLGSAGLNVVMAYPFKHGAVGGMDLDGSSYRVQVVAKLFFIAKSAEVRTRGKEFGDIRTFSNDTLFRPKDASLYAGSSSVGDGVVTLVGSANVNASDFNGKLAIDVPIRFQSVPDTIPIVEHISTYEPKMENGVDVGGETKSKWKVLFAPWTMDNVRHGDYGTAEMDNLPGDGSDDHKFRPVMSVWIRVLNASGDTVDCVPATFYEDKALNGRRISTFSPLQVCGTREPLLRFTCDASAEGIDYQQIAAKMNAGTEYSIGDQNWLQKGLWAPDPRYNNAPEDWCMNTSEDIGRDRWENLAFGASAQDGCDGDPYLFVSNQGFLQSMGELAFLPRVKDRFNQDAGSYMWGARWHAKRGQAYLDGLADYDTSVVGGLADMVWRTYEPWDNETSGDNLFGCGIGESTSGGYVNPYSDSMEVFAAALANTPVNWWAAASTNTVKDASRGQNDGDTVAIRRTKFADLKNSLEFAFNEEGSASSEERELKYESLKKMAKGMMQAFREGVQQNKDWKEIYDSWDWTPTGTPFSWAGDSSFTDQLDSIDCRYLYSFWRGCFANRQQLFLVFVRAESMALGGSGEGQIPPQQGGRAVALVWRDPETPKDSNDLNMATDRKPHRMRVLFYHQLD